MSVRQPQCCIDGDGVLVQFVEGACKHFGVPNPYDDPVNAGVYAIESLLGIPMDGFFGPLGEEFWANLEPTPECFTVIELAERYFGEENVCILTSPIRTHGCAEGKIRWIRKHLPKYARRFLIGPEKQFCASPTNVLVDDSDKNITSFQKYGGKTILVPRPWNSRHREAGNCLSHIRAGLATLSQEL